MTTKLTLLCLSAALLVSVGCGFRVDPSKFGPPPPRADEAIAAVESFYGMGPSSAEVIWYGGAARDCVDPDRPWCGTGGICWRSDDGLGCVPGETDGNTSLVSNGSGLLISQVGGGIYSVLAHELAHVKWDDPDHRKPAFSVGGGVAQITAQLAALGM